VVLADANATEDCDCCSDTPSSPCCSGPTYGTVGCFWDVGGTKVGSNEMDILVNFHYEYLVEASARPLATDFDLTATPSDSLSQGPLLTCSSSASKTNSSATWRIVDGSPTTYNIGRYIFSYQGVDILATPSNDRQISASFAWNSSGTAVVRQYATEGNSPNREFSSIAISWSVSCGYRFGIGEDSIFNGSIRFSKSFENGSPTVGTGDIPFSIDLSGDTSSSFTCSPYTETISTGDNEYTGAFGGNSWKLTLSRAIYSSTVFSGLTSCPGLLNAFA